MEIPPFVASEPCDWGELSEETRAAMLKAACSGAMRIARSRPDCEQVLAFQQPPHPSFSLIRQHLLHRDG